MRDHSRATRIAAAVTGLSVAAALVPLIPFGVAGAPIASVTVLLVLPIFAFLGLRAWLTRYPEELAEITTDLERSASERLPRPHRTDDPGIAAMVVALDAFLASHAAQRERHRDARREAEEEDKTETEFLTDLSHELRTPLNSILGFGQVLLDEIDGPLNDSQREDVETIRSSGAHLRALVDDVLDMAALQSGHVTLSHGPVDVGQIVSEVHKLLVAQRRAKPVSLEISLDPALSTIRADEKRVRQIVMNLGSNALKFTSKGRVLLAAVPSEGGVHVSVEDTGPGIPPGERDSIFLEFTQVSGSVMRRTQGSGLGLAIVKRLTELHGGRIWLDSTSGVGSTFHVFLPNAPDSSIAAGATDAAGESDRPKDVASSGDE